ncbi:MAG: hypothetical protein ABSD52_02540 [Candidatus Cybelea sp.]|jgi:hypothetical protein
MKIGVALTSTVAAVALFAASSPFAAAAPSGLAWDSVSKLAMNTDPSTLQPGSFDDDYSAAASAQPPASGGGGLFGQLRQSISNAQSAAQMMQTGMAQKHYVAGSKERTDLVAMQTATITDCVARTITTLNLRNKTYRVVSMDQPTTASSGGSSPGGSAPKDDGTRIAISVANTALGARAVGGEQTNGYRSETTITETKPTGESHTQNLNVVGYYTAFTQPFPHCSGSRPWSGDSMSPGQGMAMMAAASKVMRELATAGIDKRFSLTQSGPMLPFGNFSMYQAVTLAAKNGQGAAFVTERGHVHPVDVSDPVFSIPSDFTQER